MHQHGIPTEVHQETIDRIERSNSAVMHAVLTAADERVRTVEAAAVGVREVATQQLQAERTRAAEFEQRAAEQLGSVISQAQKEWLEREAALINQAETVAAAREADLRQKAEEAYQQAQNAWIQG